MADIFTQKIFLNTKTRRYIAKAISPVFKRLFNFIHLFAYLSNLCACGIEHIRLKDIQFDDKYTQAEHTTSDIVENLKKMKEETIAKQMKIADSAQNEFSTSSIQQNQDYIKLDMPKLATPQHPKSYVETQTQAIKKTVQPPTKLTKVYVGSYREFDQAAIVQESLVKSSLVSSPFIKNLNGYYVIQVGSFSNQEAAQNVAELLISNGYSAKMVLE